MRIFFCLRTNYRNHTEKEQEMKKKKKKLYLCKKNNRQRKERKHISARFSIVLCTKKVYISCEEEM